MRGSFFLRGFDFVYLSVPASKIKILTLTILFPLLLPGQVKDETKTKRVAFIGMLDYAYNFQDNVLGPGLGRKCTGGISFTNKKRQFIAFVALGLKGFKFNLYSPKFRQGFADDVAQHYIPIAGNNEDSLVGYNMGVDGGKGLWGTYSQFVQVGFILNNRFKPSLSFYYGGEEHLLHGGFARFEDPKYKDINYVGMSTQFYELKIGVTPPFKKFANLPGCLNLNIGYKWVDYGSFEFGHTPLSAYTTGSLADKYRHAGKFTISVSCAIWSNWQ